jgi:alpha-ribazole phosphatase/probable phosphoglycerate mutase
VRTAQIAFGEAVPLRADRRLRECDYGELNGGPREDVFGERGAHVNIPYPGGESYRDVVVRMQSFLDEVRTSESRTVLVIGHRATQHALEHLLTGADLSELVTGDWAWQPGWRFEFGR